MATSYANMPIVTSGLTLCLDAGNTKSYSGAGTSWLDLSSYGNTGTLTNGPTFNSNDVGSIVFDGTNDYASFTNTTLFSFGNGTTDSPFSVCAWIKFSSVGGSLFRGIVGKDNGTQREWAFLEAGNGKIRIFLKNTLNNPNVNQQSIDTTTTYVANTWYHVSFTYDGRGGSNAADGLSLYTNGILETPTNITKGTYVAMSNTVAQLNIARYATNYYDGYISCCQLYSRKLSTTEILQNYNATKWRFQ